MATDAKFDKVQKVLPHENADALEIAIVSNFPCIVRKGEFKEGDWCFYIRDDAKLVAFDEKAAEVAKMKADGMLVPENIDEIVKLSFEWQRPLLKYLGSGGRVKTIKLRGKVSMGILLKPETVLVGFAEQSQLFKNDMSECLFNTINAHMKDVETGTAYTEKWFGVKHWSAPQTNIGDLNTLHAGLEDNVPRSDEDNWENLDENDLHLGCEALVTKKLDGTSCTVICRADGTWSVASRSNTLRPECDNIYTKYTKEAVKAGLWYAKKHSTTIAFQGEVCCQSVQKMGINKDKELNDYFIYKCYFPNEAEWHVRMGSYGTPFHFLTVVDECNREGGFKLKTVPILGLEVVTRELLKSYNDKPAEWGEGVVLNIKVNDYNDMSSLVWDYKSKSREYLMKIK